MLNCNTHGNAQPESHTMKHYSECAVIWSLNRPHLVQQNALNYPEICNEMMSSLDIISCSVPTVANVVQLLPGCFEIFILTKGTKCSRMCACTHTHTREWLQAFKPRPLLTKGTVSLRKLRLAFTTTISDYDLPHSFKCYFPFTISLSFILYTWFNLHFLIEWITFNNLKSHSQQHQVRKGHVFLTSCMHLSCQGWPILSNPVHTV